jgi:hypothetical protein
LHQEEAFLAGHKHQGPQIEPISINELHRFQIHAPQILKEGIMRKGIVATTLTIVLVLAVAGTAYAITYGQPDEGEHPYVGFLLFYDAAYDGWFSCSGALLDKTTVLTAGHCTIDIGNDLQYVDRRGGTDIWVSFDEQVDLSTWPSRADYADNPWDLNPDRAAWLDASKDFIGGTAWPHPWYADFAGFPATYDIGIVVLDKPVRKIKQFAALPEVGILDSLATQRGQQKDGWLFETAGYGIQEVVPFYYAVDERWKATSMIVSLRSNLTDGYNLHTSNNPSDAHGAGGSCFGDSGGPVMINDTNVVVAVVSFGMNYNCKGADYSFRVDRADSQAFIKSFLH